MNDAAGAVGPATQRTAATGAAETNEKSVAPCPSTRWMGRSRLVHRRFTASWRSSESHGASLASTIERKTSVPTYVERVPLRRWLSAITRGIRDVVKYAS